MERCAICKGELTEHKEKMDAVEVRGLRCTKCGETFFSSSELLRWEIMSGKRKDNVRKIRKIGNSLTITLPSVFVKSDDISDNDLAIFKKKKNGYLIQIIHT